MREKTVTTKISFLLFKVKETEEGRREEKIEKWRAFGKN